MGDVVPPPGRKGALSTSSTDHCLPTTVDCVKCHRQNPCIHSQLHHTHAHGKPPSPHRRFHSLAVPQRKLHPLRKAGTGIQSQALTAPMRTGKHTVSGGTAESHNPPGNPKKNKKHCTPYRRVSSIVFRPDFFQSLKTSSSLCPPSCFVCQSLSREFSTARCWRH